MRPRRRAIGSAALAALIALGLPGAPASARSAQERPVGAQAGCGGPDPAAGYRVKGAALVGDVDADRRPDRVTLRVDGERPRRCRRVLVVETGEGRAAVAPVKPLPWPVTNARLLLLAEIDGRTGLEPVVALTSNAAVYRPGAVFTMRAGELARMRLEAARPADLFPFYDEFPSGVECAGRGRIVVTFGGIAEDDSYFDLRRSRYRAAGTRFERVGTARFRVEVGPEAKRRWPELRGDPFLRCQGRVD